MYITVNKKLELSECKREVFNKQHFLTNHIHKDGRIRPKQFKIL